ncbi:DNA sulfur modification protein DndE [Citrobacter sp. CK184]|uniref:DNA sulfur modification protein DndE n=1 Tax=Citrobacter koseri TaxID=545 RepID=A0A2X2VJT8_CITKO|nr:MULTISPECIES: DNA sulfur modification protein DndE [Citrobacter]HDC2121684.1 DNA sulfur modification protein DndE [Salmonella enterica]EKV5612155.1 DNA sulfur modification protein DndE [Citrobacter koseri]MBJ9245482.1 DNA sulfur modification protein DndE [Citrobacter koseri]MDB2170246.1 DNA sulfur modification protein DndE [Citrobacter farmeri]MDM3031581.1 DNA sulfur modification protein DndE [Citrobacter sp. CK185]
MQPIDVIRLSEKQKQQLITLKRKTGIDNWNVLCRWALCTSLADPTIPPKENIPSDSNVEMTWRTFGGEYYEIYNAICIMAFKKQNIENSFLSFLKCHISRGLSYLLKENNLII